MASIGELNVEIGGDVGPLDRARDKARKTLNSMGGDFDKFGSAVRKSVKIASAAAVAAVGAITLAMRSALKEADKLGDASKALGLTTEELSRIKFAAEQSGSGFEQLSAALGTLNKNLEVTASTGEGLAARALKELSISATQADGSIRPMNDVLRDVADRFSQFHDSASKSAIAAALFGDAGTKLIPLLNRGRDGIAELEAEADALGITLSSETAAAAGQFNDAVSKLFNAVGAIAKQVAAALLPAMQHLADAFVDIAKDGKTMNAIAENTAFAFKVLVDIGARTVATFLNVATAVTSLSKALYHAATLDFTKAKEALVEGAKEVGQRMAAYFKFQETLWSGWSTTVTRNTEDAIGKGFAPLISATDQSKHAIESLAHAQGLQNEALAEGRALMEAQRTPYEELIAYQERLAELKAADAIDGVTYAKAQQQAVWATASAYAGAASQITGALANVFKENKAFAIANAVVNTAQAVTAALASPPGPPFSFAYAAAAAAAGAAQIAAISSASKGGGSPARPSASGGGGSRGRDSGGGGGRDRTTRSLAVTINGEVFGREHIRNLADQLVEFQRDGGVIAP